MFSIRIHLYLIFNNRYSIPLRTNNSHKNEIIRKLTSENIYAQTTVFYLDGTFEKHPWSMGPYHSYCSTVK